MSKICQKITKSLPVTFAWLTLLTCTGLVYGFVMPYIIQTYGYWILICEGVVFAFVVCNFMLSTFMDPGRYPKANEAKDSNAPMYKNVEIDNVAVSLKWCRTCKMYRPPRCTHCNECNSCIEVFDHHCPWVNNCIGRRNYRYFFQFLWLLIVHMLALFVILVVFVWQHRQNVGSRENIVSLCVSVVIGLLCWPISGLAVFHVMLVSRGRTTNEQVTGKAKSLGDVYDQGCCHNWKQSFCGPIWPRLVDRVNTSARVEEFPKSKRDATVVRYKAKEIKVSASNDPSTKEHLYSKMQVQPTRSTMATASMVEKFSAVPAFRPGIETGYPSVDKSCRGRGGLFPDRLQNFCGRKVVLVRSSSHQSTTTNIVPPQVTTNSNLQDKISSIINTLSPSKKLTSKEYESIRSGQAAASSPISEGSLVESSAGETSSPCEALQGLMVEADEDEEVVERTRSSSRHKHSTVTNILNLESCKEPSDGRPVLTNRKRTSLSNMICRQSRNIQLEDESCLKSLLTEESNNPSTPGSGSTKRRSFILSLFKGDAVGDKPPEEIRGYDNLDFDAGHLNVDLSLLEKSPTLSARSSSNMNNNNSNTLADEKTKEFHDSLLEGEFLEDAPSSDNQDRSHRNQQTKKAQQLSLLNSIFKPSGSQGSSYSRINPFYKVNPSYAFRPTSIAFGRSPVDPVPLLPSGAVPQVGNPAKLPGDNPVILTSSYYKSNADSFRSEASLPRLESRDGNPQEHTKSNKNFDNVHRNPDFRSRQLASLELPEGAHEGAIKRPTSFLKAVKESDYLPPPCGKHFYTPQGPVAQTTTDQRFHQNHSTSLGSLPNIIPKSVDKSGDSKPTVDTIRAPMASLSEEDFNSQVNLSSFEISV